MMSLYLYNKGLFKAEEEWLACEAALYFGQGIAVIRSLEAW